MILTEEEAKKKVCPILEARSHFRKASSSPELCIGAKCMMWRWGDQKAKEPTGHCGMAGKP